MEATIPIVSVTGTNGKTTVVRMMAHAFSNAGKRVGVTTSDGIRIEGERVQKEEAINSQFAHKFLFDQSPEIAILEIGHREILNQSFGYELSDAAVITNIQPDHLGQDGIENISDLLQIKSLVAERVKAGGTLVLNADDELLVRLASDPRINGKSKTIVYFSLKPNHITLKRHTLAGGTAYTVRNNWIIEATGMGETPIIEIKKIPVTLGGLAEFNVANALAAVAACRAQDLTIKEIADALSSFQAEQHNPGRANLYEVDGAYVFLDHAHNPEAFRSFCKLTSAWDDGAGRIIGLVAVPSDRANSLIMQTGRIAARNFHRIIIRENADLCGRASGETAQILLYAVRDEAPDCDCQIVSDESEALKREITRLQPRDILVCFYENYDLARSILERCEARPATYIEEISENSFYNFRHA